MKLKQLKQICLAAIVSLLAHWNLAPTIAVADDYEPLVYFDAESTGIGSGKHIVFLAGDHEYRSEETCPALARILAKRFGFKCTVLFNVDKDGNIEPGNNNMPGLEALGQCGPCRVRPAFSKLSRRTNAARGRLLRPRRPSDRASHVNARFQNPQRQRVRKI